MILNGLGLPNRQWDTMAQDEIDALLDLRPQGLLILGYPSSPILTEKIAQEAWLWNELGRPKVLLRPYAEGIITFNPVQWAATCRDLLERYWDREMQPELLPANETNLRGERDGGTGLIEDWPEQIQWFKDFATAYRRLDPETRLHLPALSPSGNYYDGWVTMSHAGLGSLYDVVDTHIYSSYGLTDVVLANLAFDLPVCVTEINQVSPAVYAEHWRENGDIFEGVYWFLLRWIDPQPGFPNVDLLGSPFYAEFKAIPRLGEAPAADGLLRGPGEVVE